MAAGIATKSMGGSAVDEIVKPAVDLREQKAWTKGGAETWGEVQLRQTWPENLTGAEVTEASEEGIGSTTVPPGCKGKSRGLGLRGGCMLIAFA